MKPPEVIIVPGTLFTPSQNQLLGRLHRCGQEPLIIPALTIEERISKRIESEIIALGSCGPSVGISLHLDKIKILGIVGS